VTAFDPKHPKKGTEGGEHHLIFFDDYSDLGKQMKDVFIGAVAQLALRDNRINDEPRKVNFIHWDVRDKEGDQFLSWFTGYETATFPDIVYRNEHRFQKLDWQLGDDEKIDLDKESDRMMKALD